MERNDLLAMYADRILEGTGLGSGDCVLTGIGNSEDYGIHFTVMTGRMVRCDLSFGDTPNASSVIRCYCIESRMYATEVIAFMLSRCVFGKAEIRDSWLAGASLRDCTVRDCLLIECDCDGVRVKFEELYGKGVEGLRALEF